MPDADDIRDAIAENAVAPQSVSVDGTNVTAKPLQDQIKAANFVAGQSAASKPHFGLRFTLMVPPGCG